MRKPILISVFVIAAVFFILGGNLGEGGCQCNVSTAKLSDAKVCTSLTGNLCDQDHLDIPVSTPVIYASCLLKYAPSGTKVKFSWMYYGDTKLEIGSVVLNSGDNGSTVELYSNLSCPDNGWPAGVYEVIIQVQTDNAMPLVKQFNIN
ncbi:MAG: hypothetical protein RBS73_06790 [Prolixibacteraceae bacterium]|jgi:hypothetical protein|nr:hypothetical protein [Prolixibacteraceae bacterium]